MKTLLRYYLINVAALWVAAEIITGINLAGGPKTLIVAAAAFSVINFLVVPLIKILLLPLNLLTLGLFAWITNVLALYALTTVVSDFQLLPFYYPGANLGGFIIPAMDFSTFWVAVIASFLIGIITNFLHWVSH